MFFEKFFDFLDRDRKIDKLYEELLCEQEVAQSLLNDNMSLLYARLNEIEKLVQEYVGYNQVVSEELESQQAVTEKLSNSIETMQKGLTPYERSLSKMSTLSSYGLPKNNIRRQFGKKNNTEETKASATKNAPKGVK